MSLENARDSYVDLLVIKAEQQAQKQRLRDASKSSTQGAASSSSGKSIKTQTSFRVKNDVGGAENYKNETAQSPSLEVTLYEPCEVEEDDEDSWPIWEMTNEDPWRDINDVSSITAAAGRDMKITSIAACERIFTVPEVYDEMQSTSDMSSMVLRNRSRNLKSTDESPCHNLFNCFNPWKQQHQTTQMNKQHQNSQKNAYVESDEEEGHTILCGFEDIGEVSKALESALGEAESVNIVWKPHNLTPVNEDKAASLMKLIDVLEDDDDVQNVFANFDIADDVMEKLSV